MRKKIIPFIILLFGILFWDLYLYQNNQQLNKNRENSITKPSISAIEEEVVKSGIQKGSMAPDFQLVNLNGKKSKLSDYRGKKIILNFWATWCPPCKTEMPYLEDLYKEKDIIVLAVNLTNLEKNKNSIENFVTENHLTFPVLLDNQGNVSKIYKSITIPTSFIIDPTGKVNQKIVGPINKETMKTLLSKS